MQMERNKTDLTPLLLPEPIFCSGQFWSDLHVPSLNWNKIKKKKKVPDLLLGLNHILELKCLQDLLLPFLKTATIFLHSFMSLLSSNIIAVWHSREFIYFCKLQNISTIYFSSNSKFERESYNEFSKKKRELSLLFQFLQINNKYQVITYFKEKDLDSIHVIHNT